MDAQWVEYIRNLDSNVDGFRQKLIELERRIEAFEQLITARMAEERRELFRTIAVQGTEADAVAGVQKLLAEQIATERDDREQRRKMLDRKLYIIAALVLFQIISSVIRRRQPASQ